MFDDHGNVIGMTDLGGNVFINLFIPVGDALRALAIDIQEDAMATSQGTKAGSKAR